MEILGGIALAVVLLALVGVVTVAAIPLMVLLGLLTEFSFKRVFFASFAMALVAPILLGVAIGEAVQDGSIQREIQSDLRDVSMQIDFSDDDLQDLREARDAMPPDRLERIEEVFEERPELRQILPPEVVEIIENRDVREDVVVIEGNAEPVTDDSDPDPNPDETNE